MRAMMLSQIGQPLALKTLDTPIPKGQEVRIKVLACGVCRTDLHVVDGELTEPSLPLIPGHQIVGTVDALGPDVTGFVVGDRVGVPWLGQSCGECPYCIEHAENLCNHAIYTGYQRNGGFADFCLADSRFILPLPADESPTQLAPLLCAGLIGFRALSKLPPLAKHIGFYGFGASAHILTQIVTAQEKSVYAFTQPGDTKTQDFAETLGAVWAGESDEKPPVELDGAIIFAPVGALVPTALSHVKKGGTVVCAGIHMSDIPSFPYALLWGERQVCSVANLTRADGKGFFEWVSKHPVKTTVTCYALEKANDALSDLKAGRLNGAAVIDLTMP